MQRDESACQISAKATCCMHDDHDYVYMCVCDLCSLISLSSQLILLLFFNGKIGFLHFYILMRSGSGIIDP